MIGSKLMVVRGRSLLRPALIVIAICLAALLSACGGGSDSSSGAATQASTTEGGAASEPAATTETAPAEELKQPSAADAKAAAEKVAGKPVALPEKTIGILQIAGVAESAASIQKETEKAADVLGWKTVACDGEGDPSKIAACAESLITQNVDGIIDIANEASIFTPALERAQSKDIPVVNVAGAIAPSPLIAASYTTDNTKEGEALAAWVLEQFESAGEEKSVAIATFPAGFAEKRSAALEEAAEENGVDVATTWDVDGTNVQTGTQQKVAAALTQYPDLGAVWTSYEDALPPAGQVITSKFPGKSFPERPLAVGFGQTTPILGALRSGQVDAAAEDAIAMAGWMGIDQFAQHFARNEEFDQDPELRKYDFPFFGFRVLTKEDIPASGPIPFPSDFTEFFKTKWGLEFK